MNTYNNRLAHLKKTLNLFLASLNHLEYSYKKCISIIKHPVLSEEELELLEALTSRFARSLDLFTQKILPALFLVLQESPSTQIDKFNLAEKLGLAMANELYQLRELRNRITHDYTLKELKELFTQVIAQTPSLLKLATSSQQYINKM